MADCECGAVTGGDGGSKGQRSGGLFNFNKVSFSNQRSQTFNDELSAVFASIRYKYILRVKMNFRVGVILAYPGSMAHYFTYRLIIPRPACLYGSV